MRQQLDAFAGGTGQSEGQMQARRFKNLKELRERLLGYSRDAVCRLGDLPVDRIRAIEDHGDAPTVSELETLASLYGLDAELLGEEPIVLGADDPIEVMASLEEFQAVSDSTKARIVAASRAAIDLTGLRQRTPTSPPQLSWSPPAPRSSETRPWAVGRHYAERLRARLRLGDQPIRSVRDMVSEAFPEVTVLYAHLGLPSLAGLTFADRKRGLTIVLNFDGKNTNPCVRRFSLAHELCHLLVDWDRKEPLATFSGFLSEQGLEREQRANAFAVRLLCPERVVRRLARQHAPVKVAQRLIRDYGIHLEAAKLYLQNVAGETIPDSELPLLRISALMTHWEQAEAAQGLVDFPVPQVPTERRTLVASHASQLYSQGELLRDEFARLLGVTPAQDLEAVLYRFAFDLPSDDGEE